MKTVCEMRERGAYVPEIAKHLGLTNNQVRGVISKSGYKLYEHWSELDDKTLLEMTERKCSAREIGKVLGRSRDSVNQRRYYLRKRKK